MGPWNSLASQLDYLVRDLVSKNRWRVLEEHPLKLTQGLYTHIHTEYEVSQMRDASRIGKRQTSLRVKVETKGPGEESFINKNPKCASKFFWQI